jgi:hypothetical protein
MRPIQSSAELTPNTRFSCSALGRRSHPRVTQPAGRRDTHRPRQNTSPSAGRLVAEVSGLEPQGGNERASEMRRERALRKICIHSKPVRAFVVLSTTIRKLEEQTLLILPARMRQLRVGNLAFASFCTR